MNIYFENKYFNNLNMDWLDIVTFLSISKNLKSKDIINFCNSNQKIKNLCDKYSDTIWSDKLYNDFKISQDQIIGNPKSYYIGLENDIYQYYFYNFETDEGSEKIIDLEVKQISKEDSDYDDHFKIPGVDKISNIDVVVGIMKVGHRIYGTQEETVYSKSLKNTLNKLVDLIEEYYSSKEYTDIKDDILKMELNTVMIKHLDIKGEFISGIYYPVGIDISVFKVTL